MSNKSKKSRRFLATSASATLVATAIFPIVSSASTFPDVDNSNPHVENINALVEAGIIKGYQDGTFKPNSVLTRGHVVKMLGKWVESRGFKIPADYNTVQRFNDVPVNAADQELVKYAALVKDTGVFIGSNGNLNPIHSISRENMALTLDRAYRAVYGKSLVELATNIKTIPVADLHLAKNEAQEEIQAMRNLGISNVENFQPKETVTRAQFASFLNRTIIASPKSPENGTITPTGPIEIKSFEATGVNQLTITFNHAVTTTDAAKFEVARNTTAIAISKVEWNKEKTQAVLKVDHKFGDGIYQLTINGIAEKTLTASVTTTREKVDSFKFLSDKLVLTGREEVKSDKKTYKEAIITFALFNQYGENITNQVGTNYLIKPAVKKIDIYGNENDIKLEKGRFIVWVDEDEDDNATGTVELTYEQNDNEISIKQDVQLSDISEPAKVEIVGVYNPSDRELSVKNLEDEEEFSILFKVKDQYGIEMDAEFAEKTKDKLSTSDSTILEEVRQGIRVNVTDDEIFEVEDEEGTGNVFGKDGIKILNVDGEYYFAIDIFANDPSEIKGGENTVTFRSKATGEETSQTFNTADDDQPHRIELGLSEDIIAGDEVVKLPVSAYNRAGNLITDVKVLNDSLREEKIKLDWDTGLTKLSGSAPTVFTFIEEKGNVFIKFETGGNLTNKRKDYDIEIEVNQSRIETELTVFVEPNAYPVSIAKLKDTNVSNVFIGDVSEVELKHFIIEDQYGRPFTNKSAGTAGTHKFYEFKATSQNKDVFTVTPSGSKFNVKSLKKGNGTIEFTLISYDLKGNKLEDKLDVTFRTFEIKDFDSFKVKSDSLLYAGDEFIDKAGIKVFGVKGKQEYELLNDGKTYSITTNDRYLNTDGREVTADSAAIIPTDLLDKESDRYEAEIIATINETGDQVKHKLKLAREKAKANTFEITESNVVGKKILADIDVEFEDVSEDSKLTVKEIFDEIIEEGSFEIKEQYNNKHKTLNRTTGEVVFPDGTSDFIKFTVSDVNSTKNIVSSNGTSDLTVNLGDNGLKIGDSFTLTLSINNKSQKVKVYLR